MRTKFVWPALLALVFILFHQSPSNADVATLADLVGGATLTEGSTVFSNFQIQSDVGTVTPDIALIDVMTVMNGLEFMGNDQFSLLAGLDSVIFQLSFDTTSSTDFFGAGGVDFTAGSPIAGTTGVIDVFNEFSDSSSAFVGLANAVEDPLFGISQQSDFTTFSTTDTQISSLTSFSLFGDPNAPVSLDSFRVTLAVPEPSSVTVLALAGVVLLRRRSRRRN